MARPPENMPPSYSDDDQSHRLGMELVKQGRQMVHFGMHMMQYGGSLLNNSAESTTPNSEAKRPAEQDGTQAIKRTRLFPPYLPFGCDSSTATASFADAVPITPTSMSHIASTAPLHTPSSGNDDQTEHSFPLPLPNLDPSSIFPAVGTASNLDYDRDMIDEDIKRYYELPDHKQVKGSEKKQGSKERTYLKKLVANTIPKVTLKKYFEQHDGDLICLCGRGGHNKHPGNQYYRDLVSKHLKDYNSSNGRKEKLTNAVVREFEDQGRRFFALNDDDEWEEMDQESARTSIKAKVSQRFRDARYA